MRIPSPITWIGGKSRMLKHILPLLEPAPGESIYVEPFGGSGVVLLNKPPHPSETYNDTDGDLVNLFRVIRDPDGVVHLWWELINTPVAREEFRDSLQPDKFSPLSPVQRAALFVIRCRQRIGGGQPGDRSGSDRNWGTARGSTRGMNDCVGRWLGTMMALPEVHRRYLQTVIDHQDGVRCVKQWDSPSTLFYLDPPYIGKEGCYSLVDESLHVRLADALNAAQGRAVLSYYEHPDLDRLYPAKRWVRKRVETLMTASGHAKRDPNGKAGRAKACQKRVELILTNFDPATRRKLAAK